MHEVSIRPYTTTEPNAVIEHYHRAFVGRVRVAYIQDGYVEGGCTIRFSHWVTKDVVSAVVTKAKEQFGEVHNYVMPSKPPVDTGDDE